MRLKTSALRAFISEMRLLVVWVVSTFDVVCGTEIVVVGTA